MIRPLTLLTVVLAAASGAYLFAVKHRAQVLDDQLAAVAQESRLDGQRIRVLQAQWALEIDPTRLSHLAGQFTTLQPVKPDQLVTLAALRQVLPPAGVAAPEPNPEEPMPVVLDNPSSDQNAPTDDGFATTLAANGLPLPPPQMPPQTPLNSAPQQADTPVVTKLAAADPSSILPTIGLLPTPAPSKPRPAPHRVHAAATRLAQNVPPPAFGVAHGYEIPAAPRDEPMGAQLVSERASAATATAMATSNTASAGGSMLGMAQNALAPPQPLGTDN